MQFTVIDLKTGERPDVREIALKEDWAKNLVYCDIDGFYLGQDGELMLADECGNYAVCPSGRFRVKTAEKAMLVMDMPECCDECFCRNDITSWCRPCNRVIPRRYEKPDWCPLKAVPKKYETVSMDFERGYNACVDEILTGG